jgi:hypothetical protein
MSVSRDNEHELNEHDIMNMNTKIKTDMNTHTEVDMYIR